MGDCLPERAWVTPHPSRQRWGRMCPACGKNIPTLHPLGTSSHTTHTTPPIHSLRPHIHSHHTYPTPLLTPHETTLGRPDSLTLPLADCPFRSWLGGDKQSALRTPPHTHPGCRLCSLIQRCSFLFLRHFSERWKNRCAQNCGARKVPPACAGEETKGREVRRLGGLWPLPHLPELTQRQVWLCFSYFLLIIKVIYVHWRIGKSPNPPWR